jgi:hypothetical protein
VYTDVGGTVEPIVFSGPKAGYLIGASVATGDLDGDGTGEIVFGAPGESRIGCVYGYTALKRQLLRSCGATPGSKYGQAVAVGDVDNDGLDDVLVGAPFDKNTDGALKAGSVTLMRGNGSFLTKETGAVAGDNLGASVAFGYVNDDANADFIAAAPGADKLNGKKKIANAGAVFVWNGDDLAKLSSAISGSSANELLGKGVASGDVNGDGNDDIIIGSPGADVGGTNTGSVQILSGVKW